MEKWMWSVCNRIWRGEGWIEEWNEWLVAPVMKKGEGKKVEDYRRVSITPTLYKVYAIVLVERLKREVEGKKVVPHNQTGFRKGMGK